MKYDPQDPKRLEFFLTYIADDDNEPPPSTRKTGPAAIVAGIIALFLIAACQIMR